MYCTQAGSSRYCEYWSSKLLLRLWIGSKMHDLDRPLSEIRGH